MTANRARTRTVVLATHVFAVVLTSRGCARAAPEPPSGARVTPPSTHSTGLAESQRRWRTLSDAHAPMEAGALTRSLGVPAYAPWSVFDGTRWIPDAPSNPAAALAARRTPTLESAPTGGQVLHFGYVVPDGQPGSGPHVASFRLLDHGILLDEAPHPERR